MSEYQCDHCSKEVPDGDGLYLGDDRVCEKCYMTCNECGSLTTDDESSLWMSVSDMKPHSRVCFTCCPPDLDEEKQ